MLTLAIDALMAVVGDSADPIPRLRVATCLVSCLCSALLQPLVEPVFGYEFAAPEAEMGQLRYSCNSAGEGFVYVGLRAPQDLSHLTDRQNARCTLHTLSSIGRP